MSRDFKRARLEKLVQNNPVQDVALPARLKRDKRPRAILTDGEIEKFLAAKDRDLELKMLSLVARSEGGMRTAELVRWDWAMIDTASFAACAIARAKTGDVQRLEVPEMLRPSACMVGTVRGPEVRARVSRASRPASRPGQERAQHLLRETLAPGVGQGARFPVAARR